MGTLTEQVRAECDKYGAPSYLRNLLGSLAGVVDALCDDVEKLCQRERALAKSNKSNKTAGSSKEAK